LKQNNINDRIAARSNMMPIAIPAFPATLMPPELGLEVAFDGELAGESVEREILDDAVVVGNEMSVAATREAEAGTDVWPGVIAVGRPVELDEEVAALGSTMIPVPSSVGDAVVVAGSCEAEVVVAAGARPKVE
jgi:hypothetical protein